MDKKPFQDITPPKRSIRDIPLSSTPSRKTHTSSRSQHKKTPKDDEISSVEEKIVREEVNIHRYEEYIDIDEDASEHKPRWGKVALWTLGVVLIMGGGLYVSSFFKSAVIEVQVKNVTAEVDTEVKFSDKTSFSFVSQTRDASQAIAATGEKQVSTKATGKIVIYNKNLTSQKLVAQTRFESAASKVYRISSAVTVPAGKKSGSTITPGSLEVTVTADAPGESYNAPLTDFTLPGFEGSAKYSTVYARSKTEMTGGALGTVKVASADDVAVAEESLKQALAEQLVKEVKESGSFLLLDNLYSIEYGATTQESKDSGILVRKKATITGLLINKDSLASYLAADAIGGYSQEPVTITNIDELVLTPNIAASAITASVSGFSLKVKGSPHFVYQYDAEKMKQDLAGMSRSTFPTVVATYPGIEKANAVIQPFWNSRFPEDITKMSIKEE